MRYLSNFLKVMLAGFLLWATALFVYAFFTKPILGEAYIGSFDAYELSEGWTMTDANGNVTENVTLPLNVESTNGGKITLTNTLLMT